MATSGSNTNICCRNGVLVHDVLRYRNSPEYNALCTPAGACFWPRRCMSLVCWPPHFSGCWYVIVYKALDWRWSSSQYNFGRVARRCSVVQALEGPLEPTETTLNTGCIYSKFLYHCCHASLRCLSIHVRELGASKDNFDWEVSIFRGQFDHPRLLHNLTGSLTIACMTF
jgi:hypothetical protein